MLRNLGYISFFRISNHQAGTVKYILRLFNFSIIIKLYL